MKVLLVNGSSNMAGSTFTALSEVAGTLQKEGIETEIFQLGSAAIRECTACGACALMQKNACVFKDDCVNELIEKAAGADGFVFGTPVYYAHPSGRLLSALDRAFYAGGSAFAHKPGFAVAVARRAGTTASLDAVTKHFTINQMPVVSSTYWTMVHGAVAEDVPQEDVYKRQVTGSVLVKKGVIEKNLLVGDGAVIGHQGHLAEIGGPLVHGDGGLQGLLPVSYTHLDVYKRQVPAGHLSRPKVLESVQQAHQLDSAAVCAAAVEAPPF